jgi:hypothetical protein
VLRRRHGAARFGGLLRPLRRSDNGREHGVFGFEEYLEVNSVLGYQSA